MPWRETVHGGIGGELGSFCGTCLRGGPSMWAQPALFGWGGFTADQRKPIVPGFGVDWGRSDNGRSWRYNLGPNVYMRLASRFSSSIGMNYSYGVQDRQWLANYGAIGSDTTHYTVARLDQRTVSVTTRVNWTASPTLSLQVYAQPFATGGDYSNWRRVRDPPHRAYAAQFQPFRPYEDPGCYNFKQFRSNTVLRWEYHHCAFRILGIT